MVQNMNNIKYALMLAAGPQQAAAGETYQLPANSLIGEICHQRKDRGIISEHRLSMGIPAGNIADPLYGKVRDTVKNQMLPRGYLEDLHHFPDVEFPQIVTGMRQLRPACNELATRSAANDISIMQEVDEAVIQLIKDCDKKLTYTIKRPKKRFPLVPGVPPGLVRVPDILLPANTACNWFPWGSGLAKGYRY